MPTDKPRFTITMDANLYKQIEDFKFEHRYKNQTQAVLALIDLGIRSLVESDSELANGLKQIHSAQDDKLLESFHQLNDEGQERILEYTDDLVSSGKYKKTGQNRMVKEA